MCSKIMLPNTPLHATLHERTNSYTPDVSEVNIVACLITVSLVEIQIIYLLRKSKGKRAKGHGLNQLLGIYLRQLVMRVCAPTTMGGLLGDLLPHLD